MDVGKLYAIIKDNQSMAKLCGLALVCTLILSGHIQTLLINTCIFGFLSYRTIKFISQLTPDTASPLPMVRLLKQWTVFSALTTLEFILGPILGFIFTAIKLAGFVLLLQNSELLMMPYDLGLVPLFTAYGTNIDWIATIMETKANTFRGIPGNETTDYSIMRYIEPYVNWLLSFTGQVKLSNRKKAQ